MELNEIKELLNQFDQSDLTEFDLRDHSFELYMNKNTDTRKSPTETAGKIEEYPSETSLTNKKIKQPTVVESSTTKTATETVTKTTPIAKENAENIVSPIVGVVYLKPAPDKENYKQVGDPVKAGEVVCIIEAMKLMNEITAPVDGTIGEILVENEAIVEFGQPLFQVIKGG
ncbi:acetyl-CoA carboxylase biotin carboxyl carrier protein [Melissococcus plutonius]|uniref:Biotin carboxyl carrier protein of acetyl-CoA carboxylase n=2 Tax=Melissococcus plutonius TaxID=33970 RepID=F3Y964_MELPT|nr:acetyl-CoA carboxylase biotin carboxyl carrier protein [Melissococcus plutonius]BAL62555.1 biotin carboxyl carrier protein of acetyl-CoA carboxylase [Melissococcus plutonius DAT561]AIM24626.1 biotin carboxyl carrier protein of acetyl-CoA carboxylase [Melissococcus plutonius S1]KMT24716.1 biotin carboxyl carrier protein of acetyl-CoA carboxylase [Melissococcus plutonius]KMT26353.1 biotin carboxyl carrier protein of acetyl-CoA carboxylase [Melissococcus plutonius]KMT27603.1 biotin carboxyl ca